MADEIDEFYELFQNHIKVSQKPHVVWAVVKSVDWESKTMIATGLLDDLDYEDVLLGLGSYYRKPTIGVKCLLGVIEGKSAAVFLLDAEAFDEGVTKSGDTEMIIKKEGFVFKKGSLSLRSQLLDTLDEMNNLNKELQKVVVSVGVTPNVAALAQIVIRVEAVKSKIEQIIIE